MGYSEALDLIGRLRQQLKQDLQRVDRPLESFLSSAQRRMEKVYRKAKPAREVPMPIEQNPPLEEEDAS